MDLTALMKWAKEFDVKQESVDPRHEIRIQTYLKMIVERGVKVFSNNNQTQKFMDDVQEYLEQLEKLGITPAKSVPIEESIGDAGPDASKESPLIP